MRGSKRALPHPQEHASHQDQQDRQPDRKAGLCTRGRQASRGRRGRREPGDGEGRDHSRVRRSARAGGGADRARARVRTGAGAGARAGAGAGAGARARTGARTGARARETASPITETALQLMVIGALTGMISWSPESMPLLPDWSASRPPSRPGRGSGSRAAGSGVTDQGEGVAADGDRGVDRNDQLVAGDDPAVAGRGRRADHRADRARAPGPEPAVASPIRLTALPLRVIGALTGAMTWLPVRIPLLPDVVGEPTTDSPWPAPPPEPAVEFPIPLTALPETVTGRLTGSDDLVARRHPAVVGRARGADVGGPPPDEAGTGTCGVRVPDDAGGVTADRNRRRGPG